MGMSEQSVRRVSAVRIAVIGAGNMGRALTRALNVAGHTVTVTARNSEHAQKVADELKVATAGSNREAARDADMVVLAVPSNTVAAIVEDLDEVLGDAIVVDTTNPSGLDRAEILRGSASLAEAILLLAPGTRVVKAFNTVFAGRLNDPVIDGVPLDGFYAGDDPAAKQVVADLLAEMGFRPVDTGELLTARVLELMAFLNIDLNLRYDWPWQSGWKLLGPTG
uniref:NADPH-dependent F420 reductase n=1 Tax=Paractinoplanes polyasparticus TaxID=2856853 RepID=UPI0027DF54C5|nr:NADPH-dependent F420 reductase [Actinoplanes polyasparticus]